MVLTPREIYKLDIKDIDIVYDPNSHVISFDSNDIMSEIIKKIINSTYFSYSKIDVDLYNSILEIIKEMNFDSFIELKNKIFQHSFDPNDPDTQNTYSLNTVDDYKSIRVSLLMK